MSFLNNYAITRGPPQTGVLVQLPSKKFSDISTKVDVSKSFFWRDFKTHSNYHVLKCYQLHFITSKKAKIAQNGREIKVFSYL